MQKIVTSFTAWLQFRKLATGGKFNMSPQNATLRQEQLEINLKMRDKLYIEKVGIEGRLAS